LNITTQSFDSFDAALDAPGELLAVVQVVGERRVDLPERQVRMLEVKLLRTPSMRLLLDN
jgi:hypothetical protein